MGKIDRILLAIVLLDEIADSAKNKGLTKQNWRDYCEIVERAERVFRP